VKLVYEKVIDNIKTLLKSEKKEEANLNNSQSEKNINVNESKDISMGYTDDEALKMYHELLENLKKRVDNLIQNQTHEQFKNIMREKGYEPPANKPKLRGNKSDERLYRDLNAKDDIVYDQYREEDEINILRAREEIIRDYNRAKEKEKLKAHEPREKK
jgi:hypothetical protein